jgi:hypothetical protein
MVDGRDRDGDHQGPATRWPHPCADHAWHAFAHLTRQDVRAIVAFLKSLPPVKNKVPGPFGPSEKPTSFVMKIVPPETATK